jgi:hypothetical protein
LSHSLDFYKIFKQLSGQSAQYRPARTALQQNPFPQKYTENSRFYHREHREQPFNHEVHEGNEDNTLSQCILCGDAYKATLLLEKRTDLRYIQQFIGH